MRSISSKHIKILRRRVDFLTERIDEDTDTTDSHGYDKSEVAALKAVIEFVDDEERNLIYERVSKKAYGLGQKNLLKFYKKSLGQAVRSGNVSALQFLLDRTNEWLAQLEKGPQIEEGAEEIQ